MCFLGSPADEPQAERSGSPCHDHPKHEMGSPAIRTGVDLPMKIVDMFSERTPVAALDYGPVLAEQVEMGVTGWGFRTAQELAALLDRLASEPDAIENARQAIEEGWRESWGEAWRLAVSVTVAPR